MAGILMPYNEARDKISNTHERKGTNDGTKMHVISRRKDPTLGKQQIAFVFLKGKREE